MDKRFFKVLRDNLDCAFCKEKLCPMRYYPNHHKMVSTIRIGGCKKEMERRYKKMLKRKLP